VNVSAGYLHSAGAAGNAVLNVSNAANIWMASVFGSGTMNMVGGEIARVQVFDSSILNLRGGIIGEGISTSTAFRKSRYYAVISTGAMRSIAQRRNLFL
jgi:hypothetical protein